MVESKSARDALRAKLLGQKKKPRVEIVKLFGEDVELRQPTLDSILSARETESTKERSVDMIIQYAYVPGTDLLVFEEGDKPDILSWPFGDDLLRVQKAIVALTGIDISEADKTLKKDPLEESSSQSPAS